MLWNPAKKQPLHFRPEERVRLRIMDFLILECNIPAGRIAVESPVPGRFSGGRTDLLCYDGQFQPWLLVECKAENITLSSKTATQSATYNRFVKAPYILLTNGLQDALFEVSGTLHALDPANFPDPLQPEKENYSNNTPEYWTERGFLPSGMRSHISLSCAKRLSCLFHEGSETRSFISLSFPADGMDLSHYYLILPSIRQKNTLIAFTVLALGPSEAVICAIKNQNKRNTACFRVRLSTSGELSSPEIIEAGNTGITTPDITGLEDIWTGRGGIPESGQPDAFATALTCSLETIFTSS